MKQQVQASKKRGKSIAEGRPTVGGPILSKEQAHQSDTSNSDFSDDQRHYSKCEYCRFKNPGDYLRERRAARERNLRKRSISEAESCVSIDQCAGTKHTTKSLLKVSSSTSCIVLEEPKVMATPKQSSQVKKGEGIPEVPVQEFLIKTNEDIHTLERMMRDRDYRITVSNEGPSGKGSAKSSSVEKSPIDHVQLTPKNHPAPVSQFSAKNEVRANQLFSIKEIDQSASFGESSQVDPKHLNFQNSPSRMNLPHEKSQEKRVYTKSTVQKNSQASVGPSQMKITLKFNGKLQERTWSGASSYLPVLQRIRKLFG